MIVKRNETNFSFRFLKVWIFSFIYMLFNTNKLQNCTNNVYIGVDISSSLALHLYIENIKIKEHSREHSVQRKEIWMKNENR